MNEAAPRLNSARYYSMRVFLFLGLLLVSALLTAFSTSEGAVAASNVVSQQTRSASSKEETSPAQAYFTNTVLVNQNGEKLRFYSDLLKDRIVIINAFFTSCKGVCPTTMARLKKVQDWLGTRLNRDAYILSLTVDPETDTPARLSEYARSLQPKPGWHLLSGEPDHVEFMLKKLGQYVDEPDAHTNLLILGNESTGLWKKAFVLADWEDLIVVMESVLFDGV